MAPPDFNAYERLATLVVVLDVEAAIVWWNPAWAALSGLQLAAWRGQPFAAVLSPADAARSEQLFRDLRDDGQPRPLEVSLRSADGSVAIAALVASVATDDRGLVASLLLSGVDVSATLARSRADQERLRALLDRAPDGIFVADLDGRYTEVNDAGCRMLGYTRDELVGMTIVDLIPAELRDRLWRERDEMLTGRSLVSEWTLRRKDGNPLPVEIHAQILPEGRWQGFVRDLSHRKQLERRLRDSLADLNRAQSVAKVGSWRLDVTRNELRWSPENYRIFGVAEGTAMTYEGFLACVHPDDRAFVDRRWRGALRGEPYDIEHRLLVDGELKWVREKADIALGADGTAVGGIGVTWDITDLKRATEEQRRLQARLAELIAIAADAIVSVDEELRIVLFNRGAERIFGWQADELLGRPLDLLVPERFRAGHRAQIERFAAETPAARPMAGRRPGVVGLRRNGEEFPAEGAISTIEIEGRRFFTAILRDVSDRRAAERERERLLHEVETERRRLRDMLDTVPMGMLLCEADGRLHPNRRAEELVGMRLSPQRGFQQFAERVLRPDGTRIPPDQIASARVLRTGETILGEEYVIERPDGSRVPVLGSAAPLRDADGRVVGAVAAFQDISERMRAEDALRVSEERLRVSLSAAPLVVFNQDTRLRYTWVHNPTRPITLQQALQGDDRDLFPPEDAARLMSLKRQVIQTGVGIHEIVRVRIGGEVRWFDLTVEPLRNTQGEVVGITGAGWNVTRQRQVEDEQRVLAEAGAVLMHAAPSYDRTLAALADLVVRELADWCIVDVVDGPHVRRLRVSCSDPAKASLAKSFEELEIDRERPHLIRETLDTRRSTLVRELTPELLARYAQHEEHLELLQRLGARALIVVPLLAGDRLLGALGLVSSSEARRYDDRMLQLVEQIGRIAALAVENAQLHRTARRALAAREEILGIVAHDLRTPLSTITMMVDLLPRRDGPERRSLRPVDAIRRAAQRMNHLIRDMLDVAHLDAGALRITRERLPSRALLEEAYETHRDAAARLGLRLRVDAPPELPDVLGDRERLLQVLDNLLGNAEKFTPAGGEIVLGAVPGDFTVRFRVTDTGAGIPRDQLPRLFDRFWQARGGDRRGAGLGLFIVKGLVEAHGGEVDVDSEVDRGTTFSFTVPLAPPDRGPDVAG